MRSIIAAIAMASLATAHPLVNRQAASATLTTVTSTQTMLLATTFTSGQALNQGAVYVINGATTTVATATNLATPLPLAMVQVVTKVYTATQGVTTGVPSESSRFFCDSFGQLWQCGSDVTQSLLCPQNNALRLGCAGGTRCVNSADTSLFRAGITPLPYPHCYSTATEVYPA